MPDLLQQTDREVVERFLSETCEDSFRCLFDAFAPRLRCYFRLRGCDSGLSEELTQDVMMSVYRHRRSLREPSCFPTWLFKIARNTLLAHLRSSARKVATVDLETLTASALRHDPDLLSKQCFREWMRSLSPTEQRVMRLRFVDNLEYHEIASLLKAPVGTIQWRVFQAKRKLAARFSGSSQLSPVKII